MLLNRGGEGENFSSGVPENVLPLLGCVYKKKPWSPVNVKTMTLMDLCHGVFCVEKWISFLCPSPGNRPWQSCGAVVGWELCLCLFIWEWTIIFSQAEFVSPMTAVGEKCSSLYLQPWTFWFHLLPLSPWLWESAWAACLSSLSHCCFKAMPSIQTKKCQQLQMNQSKKFQIIALQTGRQYLCGLCGEGNVCTGKRMKPRGNDWVLLCLLLVTCIAVRKWAQAEDKMWDALSCFQNQQHFCLCLCKIVYNILR